MHVELAPRAGTSDPAKGVCILTCSFSDDFESCRILCESVDRFVPKEIKHRLFVPTTDLELFSSLATDRRSIESQDKALLPWWFRKVPLPNSRWRARLRLPRRNIYVTPYSLPVRGWIAQQIMKISAASEGPTEIVLHVDSDNVFVRPITLDRLARDNRYVRLYQQPKPVDRETHRLWHLTASRLLGLPPDEFHSGDYIDQGVVWHRSVVRQLIARIEEIGGQDWRIVLACTPHFSEYILYGVFAERVLGLEQAGLLAEPFSLSHSTWSDELKDYAEETSFVESLRPKHIILNIQSTLGLAPSERRRLANRVTAFAVRQEESAAN